jgi:alpha-1,2-mannosyltransferase
VEVVRTEIDRDHLAHGGTAVSTTTRLVARRQGGTGLLVVVLWAGAFGLAAILAYQRYRNASVMPADFSIFFRAAHAVTEGQSPYSVPGYVYPPLVAIVLAPFSHLAEITVFHVWLFLSLAGIGLVAGSVVWSESGRFLSWQTPLFFGFCAVTGYHFWPLVIELPDGQSDVLTLAVLATASLALTRGRSALAGGLIGLAGLLKGWPAAVALVFAQRGGSARARGAIACACVLVTAPLMALAVSGPSGPRSMGSAIFDARSQPRLASYSVWGLPRLTFSQTPIGHPLLSSPVLQVLMTLALLGWVAALLTLSLRQKHADPSLPFWNVIFCITLLLPVSHLTYTLYVLPVLWLWAARVLPSPRLVAVDTAVCAVMILWWLVVSQSALGQDTSQLSATVVFFAGLVACTASVVGIALADRGRTRSEAVEAAIKSSRVRA